MEGAPHPAHLWRGFVGAFACEAEGESCADALDLVVAMKRSLRGPGPEELPLLRGLSLYLTPILYPI